LKRKPKTIQLTIIIGNYHPSKHNNKAIGIEKGASRSYTSSSINYGPKTSFTPTIVPCHAQLQWDAGGSNSGKQYPQL